MDNSRIVYSTESGRICVECEKPMPECNCHKLKKDRAKSPTPSDGVIRIARDSKGRNGKTVTRISGIPLEGEDLEVFIKDLKKRCGTGGTIKDGIILIQGDHRQILFQEIKKKGYPVKIAGG